MENQYIIRVQANHDCWIDGTDGDPGRTRIREGAKVLKVMDAKGEAMRLKRQYPKRGFSIEPVDRMILTEEAATERIIDYPSNYWEDKYNLEGLTDLQKVQIVIQAHNEVGWVARKKKVSSVTGIPEPQVSKIVKELPVRVVAAFTDEMRLAGSGYWLSYII